MRDIILRNRYTLLLTTLVAYMAVLVAEGAITGREARIVDFENPFFGLNVNNFEFHEQRENSRINRNDDARDNENPDNDSNQ